jgi:hypothetical protein
VNLREKILSRASGTGQHAISFAIGLLMALVLYYVLYRIGLPSKPFIYVAF